MNMHTNNPKACKNTKRVTYQILGEKFKLYTWLKPIKMLGEGAFASVCEVIDTKTNTKYAIKKNRNVFSNIHDARGILREIKLMNHFHHPNIMSLNGVILPENQHKFNNVYLIMNKFDTTLKKIIKSKSCILTEIQKQYIIYQICRGLEYMHSGGIIHRDLKPENILINCNCKINITDFGLARCIKQTGSTRPILTEYVVTRWYRAPEVMCCRCSYDSQIDVWSLGCITAELYTKCPLFRGCNHIQQLKLIFDCMGTPQNLAWITTLTAKNWIAKMPTKLPKDLKKILPDSTNISQDFISKLLTINPHKRPNITTILKHEWLKEFFKITDYIKCKTFNISFENDPIIKTSFGIRYKMYQELSNIYKQ